MVKKTTKLFIGIMMCVFCLVSLASCGGDDDDNQPVDPNTPAQAVSPIVGTWVCSKSIFTPNAYCTLVFNNDYSGYIRNEYDSGTIKQMNFDWSLKTTCSGPYLLSVIYKSGDRLYDGPFIGGYARYNSLVTIAGYTLSIPIDNVGYMVFGRHFDE